MDTHIYTFITSKNMTEYHRKYAKPLFVQHSEEIYAREMFKEFS